ncbi:MAG: hypothetical protein NT002_01015 [candidate division Zixibacteria bacterium]|nr:hypothetical protein [candidate division Zixibacteria bacterium]
MSTDIVKLFSNIGYGLRMIKRGRLAIIPKKLKRINQIRAIIEKANQFEEA